MGKKWWRISKKTIGIIVRVVETALAFLIVVGGLGFWRLYTAPVQVESLLPDLAARLIPAEAGLRVQAESVLLGAGGDGGGLVSVSIRNLVITRSDETVVTRLPEVEMSYGLWDIITLDYVPSVLTVKNPLLQMIIDPNGRLYVQSEANAPVPEAVQQRSAAETLQTVDAVIRYLLSFNELSLEEAKVVIDDRQKGEQLSLPVVNVRLSREFGFNHVLSAEAAVLVEKDLMQVTAQARLNRLSRKMDFKVAFEDVSLNRIGRALPFLAEADLVVDGQVSGSFDFRHSADVWNQYFEGGAFQLKTAGSGTLNLPAPLTNEYHVKQAVIRGAIGEDFERIKIAQSEAILAEGPTADLNVTVEGLGQFFKTGDVAAVKTVLKADVRGVQMDMVPSVWPSALGPDAHAWVKKNLRGGTADKAMFTLYFTGGELVDLFGDMAVRGVQVRYLPEMTPVEGVAGQVLLYPDRVRILVDTGTVGDLRLKKADVDLRRLLDPVSEAHIVLTATGPVDEAMRLIAEKPLEFPQMFGIRPDQTGGTADVDVDLTFPLIEDLEPKQVQVQVEAKIADGIFETPLSQATVTQAGLDLRVDNQGLRVSGNGLLAGIPVELVWDENFTPSAEESRSRYRIKGTATDEQVVVLWSDVGDWISGAIGADVDIQVAVNGTVRGKASLDLMGAEAFLYPISVMKAAGVPMIVTGEALYQPDSGQVAVQFALDGYADAARQEAVQVVGQVEKEQGIVIDLEKVSAPGSSFSGRLEFGGGNNVIVRLVGDAWDVSAWSERPRKENETVAEDESHERDGKTSIPNVQAPPPSVDLDIRMGTVSVVLGKPLQQVRITGKRQGYFWQNLDMSLQAGGDVRLMFRPDTKEVTASVSDFGALLAHLGISDRIIGGTVTLTGEQPSSGGVKGVIAVRDFALADPGFLVQAVTILGIVDAIRGQNLSFQKAEIPFEVTPYQTLYLKDGYAYGTTLGVTFKGRIRPNELDVVGSVIPAYAINSLPGRIPLIGALFKDGAGGGLVGVKYEMKGTPAQPQISFNPLSSIAPGIFGHFF